MANFNVPTQYVEKEVPRSTRDLSKTITSTIHQCIHIPIFSRTMLPDDVFKSKVNTLLLSNPFQTPFFGRFKFRVSCFQSPLTNYYGWMDNNTRKTTKQIKEMSHWTISPLRSTRLMALGINPFPAVIEGLKPYASVVPGYTEDFASVDYIGDPSLLSDSLGDDQAKIRAYAKYFSVRPHSLLNHIGFEIGYIYSRFNNNILEGPMPPTGQAGWSFNADKLLVYLDVIRSYMVNNQLDYIPYFVPGIFDQSNDINVVVSTGGTSVKPAVLTTPLTINMPLDALDKFFIWLRSVDTPGDLYYELVESVAKSSYINQSDYDDSWQSHIIRWLLLLRFGGMFCVRYDNDIMQNLLTNLDSLESYLSVVDNKISINDLRQSNRDQLENDRLAISGGRYKDVLRVLWGSRSRVSLDRPQFIGTHSFYIDPQNITSTSDTEDSAGATSAPGTSPSGSGSALGQMTSFVNRFDPGVKKRFRVSVADQGVFMYIISLTPEVSYSSGIDEELMHNNFADDYKPQFARLGFQDVPDLRYLSVPQLEPVKFGSITLLVPALNNQIKTVGKEVAWAPYMTSVDRTYGLFALGQSLESFVPSRYYGMTIQNREIIPTQAVNGYADPAQWNYMFQFTDPSYPNWHLQLRVDLKAHRPIGNRYMPTIE